MNDELRQLLSERLLDVDGVFEHSSRFSMGDAFWCHGREIAHFEGTDVVDLRLTRSVIRELRPRLRTDRRVELRSGSSDWVEVGFSSVDDVAFVLELAERAVAANSPAP